MISLTRHTHTHPSRPHKRQPPPLAGANRPSFHVVVVVAPPASAGAFLLAAYPRALGMGLLQPLPLCRLCHLAQPVEAAGHGPVGSQQVGGHHGARRQQGQAHERQETQHVGRVGPGQAQHRHREVEQAAQQAQGEVGHGCEHPLDDKGERPTLPSLHQHEERVPESPALGEELALFESGPEGPARLVHRRLRPHPNSCFCLLHQQISLFV
mmetsp:Transcript_23795/g.37559  ORF Transcript_23795/g.37559 Transcript_23795/m.37559 type:complete len:211 (-) Transcript_23795:677-1309(-)